MKVAALLISLVIGLGAAVDLQAKYPFSAVLLDDNDQYYALYWNFTRSTESIYFAVNVSTTGWVGFGLSPNGQMPASDVVIGWVADGTGYFHDRYAEGRFLPPIDTVSQDWFLINSEEAGGFTVLEFSRNFTSCDPQDRDITASTARVVWSFSTGDPTGPNGEGALRHSNRGSRSLNLLGGQPVVNQIASQNELFLDFTVNSVTIPSATTTYWCESFRLPEQLRDTVHYVNRFAPRISQHASAFVHHIIIYQCPVTLPAEQVGLSGPCDDLASPISQCRQGLSIGGWAVGGEEFTFPEGVAYPLGGTGLESQQYALMEMHYDNPGMVEGVVDSSGMRFFYTTEAPEQLAGALSLGHLVFPSMIIPPEQKNYTISALCSADCTRGSIPETGIRIFANFFHTHLAGHGLTIQHYRYNEECGILEELEPIDQNLNYDFNFQQYNHLPREHVILPGDILTLKCFYDTTGRTNVTLGGESTHEEMCLTFAYYYPRPFGSNYLDGCATIPNADSFTDFYFALQQVDPEVAQRFTNPDPQQSLAALYDVDWARNPQLATALQNSIASSPILEFCFAGNAPLRVNEKVREPEPGCSYIAPDKCSDVQPLTCCERAGSPSNMHTNIGIGSLMLLLGTLMTLFY